MFVNKTFLEFYPQKATCDFGDFYEYIEEEKFLWVISKTPTNI